MIGSRIKDIRVMKGKTQKQISDLSGIGIPHISSIENNRRKPSVGTLSKLAKALNCSGLDLYHILGI